MDLFSYVVARDYGFAPNPFFGVCTLATCKPGIRKHAAIGDWVIGTGSKQKKRQDMLVYIMRVDEVMTFNEFSEDHRFQQKKPNMRGSKKQRFGDNIYYLDNKGRWHQRDSHHSNESGSPNLDNIERDTNPDRVLASTHFAYWGSCGPPIPLQFRHPHDIRKHGPNYKRNFPDTLVADFVKWFHTLNMSGILSDPLDWRDVAVTVIPSIKRSTIRV